MLIELYEEEEASIAPRWECCCWWEVGGGRWEVGVEREMWKFSLKWLPRLSNGTNCHRPRLLVLVCMMGACRSHHSSRKKWVSLSVPFFAHFLGALVERARRTTYENLSKIAITR